jgi:hypothetical protein
MHIRSIAAVATAASLMAGCAIHPEPQDVTGVTTPNIVKQIRCETRDAAREIIRKELERLATAGSNATARDLLAQYAANPDLMTGFDWNRSFPLAEDQQLRAIFALLYSGGVAYSFTLTMNEQNDVTSTANFLGPWANKLTFGLTGNANRSRENERTFTITDKFSFLLRELNSINYTSTGEPRQYCDGHVNLGPNYIYPIAGQIGVYKTVATFFQMAIFDGLAAKPGAPAGATPAMADKLTFTTLLDISATPKVVFAPVPARFQVADATATGLLRRKDTHQVIVAVALEPTGPVALDALRGFVFSGTTISALPPAARRRAVGSPLFVGNRVTAAPTTGAEALAVQMIEQVKNKEFQLLLAPNQ